MLQRMIALKQSGMTNHQIFQTMQQEFGVPRHVGEINAELHFLNKGITCLLHLPPSYSVQIADFFCEIGPKATVWDPAMEERVKQLVGQGMDSKDVTTQLFHEFAKPDLWQETYRKIQQMKLQGRIT